EGRPHARLPRAALPAAGDPAGERHRRRAGRRSGRRRGRRPGDPRRRARVVPHARAGVRRGGGGGRRDADLPGAAPEL
ncbi:MAG: hypothetical protein AVDCRST_MAG24-1651, partial [uncultured Nocardioidaceae bacterium]